MADKVFVDPFAKTNAKAPVLTPEVRDIALNIDPTGGLGPKTAKPEPKTAFVDPFAKETGPIKEPSKFVDPFAAPGPEERPDIREQMRVKGKLSALPSPISEEVKKRAIKIQRGREFGEIRAPVPVELDPVKAVKNIPQNIEDIVKETGSLIVLTGRGLQKGGKDFIEDLVLEGPAGIGKFTRTKENYEFLQNMGLQVKNEIKSGFEEFKKDPRSAINSFINERPVDAMLIANLARAAVGVSARLTLKTAAKVAGKGKIGDKLRKITSTEREPAFYNMTAEGVETDQAAAALHRMGLGPEPKPQAVEQVVKQVAFPREFSKDPLIKYVLQKPFDEALKKYPKLNKIVTEGKAKKLMENLRNFYEDANFRERSSIQEEIFKSLNKLSADELALAVPYLEGRLSFLKAPSDKFKAFEAAYRNLNTDIGNDLARLGKLTPEIVEDRAYQPLTKISGLTKEQIKSELGDFTPAYIHHHFPDKFPTKMGIHFADTTGRRFKPSIIKKSKGIAGYSENLKEIIPKWTSEYVKFKNTEGFIQDLTSTFGTKVNLKDIKTVSGGVQVGEQTFKGYKIVAPDGFLRFFRGKIDFYKEVSKKLENMTFDEAIAETIKNVSLGGGSLGGELTGGTRASELIRQQVKEALLSRGRTGPEADQMISRLMASGGKLKPTGPKDADVVAAVNKIHADVTEAFRGETREFLGVSKNIPVWLIPEGIAQRLESHAAPFLGSQRLQNFTKIVFDKPQQIWKDSVLGFSPRWIKNNVAGDIIFNSMEGVGPLSYSRAFMSKYREVIPDELLNVSFANVMKYNPKLGLAARSTIGGLAKKMGESKIVQAGSKARDVGYGINTAIEQPFVRALYIRIARPLAKSRVKKAGKPLTEENILKELHNIKTDPALNGNLIKQVKETLPVFNLLTNAERKYGRRLMPFYNWYKFMIQYSARLPKKHPFKTVGARGLGDLSEQQREEVFKEQFPFMARTIDDAGIPDRFDNLWPVGTDKTGKTIFFNARGMNVFTTIEDLLKLDVVNMMSPIIKIGVERSLGVDVFTRRKFRSGEEGIDFKEFRKTNPPLGDHILRQFPQYNLLKQNLTPARQFDTGTIFDPDPILDPVTGDFKFPIEAVEKTLNFLGVDAKSQDVQKAFDSFIKKRRAAVGETFTKLQSKADTALTLREITLLFNQLKRDKKLFKTLQDEAKAEAKQRGTEKKKIIKRSRGQR